MPILSPLKPLEKLQNKHMVPQKKLYQKIQTTTFLAEPYGYFEVFLKASEATKSAKIANMGSSKRVVNFRPFFDLQNRFSL